MGADTKPGVVVDVGTVVTLGGITSSGLGVTAQAGEIITGALGSPAAELREGL